MLTAALWCSTVRGDLILDFEQSETDLRSQGWNVPPNARIVDAPGARSRALHIQVDDPGKQKKYAEYFLPVTPGAFYQAEVRIKTQGVEPHPRGGHNRGAVIFLQLADKDRKHLMGGSFPRGLRGDHDWSERGVIATGQIPAHAAYLQVLLGVEGQGQAWFDDLRVSRIRSNNFKGVTVVSPRLDTPLNELRPVFDIQQGDSAIGRFACRLEVSQDARFPTEATFVEELKRTPHQLSHWLTPGRWHYRIIHHASGVALPPPPTRSLVIAEDATAWPPAIHPAWEWTDSPRPTLRAKIDYPQPETLAFAITIEGTPVDILGIHEQHVVFTPAQDLAPGGHRVRIEASQAGKTRVIERLFSNQRPGSHVTFREDRVMLVEGKPFYPLGTYRDPSDSIRTFDGIAQAGFNLTHDYLFEHGPQDVAVARAYLDEAHQRGLKVFMGIPRSKIRQEDYLRIENWVVSLMDHPALLLWYLMDEPELQGVSPTAMRSLRQVVRATDPFHPTAAVYCYPDMFQQWQGSHDVQWHDPYPLPSGPLTDVEKYVRRARQSEGERGPAWTVLQGFDYRYAHARERYRAMDKFGPPDQPSREQTRAMAFLALAEGTDGLVWYWLPKSAYHIVEDAPTTWQGIVETVQLMKKLEPWLLADKSASDQAIGASEPFRVWTRQVDGRRVLAIVNASDQSANFPLPFPDLGLEQVTDFETGLPAAIQGRERHLTLEPWQVRIVAFDATGDR